MGLKCVYLLIILFILQLEIHLGYDVFIRFESKLLIFHFYTQISTSAEKKTEILFVYDCSTILCQQNTLKDYEMRENMVKHVKKNK